MNARTSINILEQYRSNYQLKNPSISNVSVAWHLQHSLLVANSIIKLLVKSNPQDYRASYHFKKSLLLFLKRIPRKKAKAPNTMSPDDANILLSDIDILFDKVKDRYQQIENLPRNAYFKHFYLGNLRKAEALQFIAIHTQHHIQIIEDIIKSR